MPRKRMVLVVIAGSLMAGAACLLLAIQFVPTGVSTENPPVLAEPAWDSAQTRALAARACFDCHSNETQWPWYTRLAPMSWLAAHDVSEGRQALNFSEWGTPRAEADEAEEDEHAERGGEEQDDVEELVEVVREGEMPPASYTLLHPEARLSPAEQQQLMDGLRQTFQ